MKKYIIFMLFLEVLYSENLVKKKTICLNMIVKNESKVIKRCFDSVKNIIDYWVIVDTGSNDDTQEIIKSFMNEVPGELYKMPWVNFEENRNQALNLAKNKADYLLFIDADEELQFSDNFKLDSLDKDFYFITANENECKYQRYGIISTKLPWKWKGIIHELVECEEAKTFEALQGIEYKIRNEGCRSQDPNSYHNDIRLLKNELKKKPTDKRCTFYLARSYLNVGDMDNAISFFLKRIALSANHKESEDEEVYWAYRTIALIYLQEKKDYNLFIDYMHKAFVCRSNRAEPLYYLMNYYLAVGKYNKAYALSLMALNIPYPNDLMGVEAWIYEYGLFLEHAKGAFALKKYIEALCFSCSLLKSTKIPALERKFVEDLVLEIKKFVEHEKVEGISLKKN